MEAFINTLFFVNVAWLATHELDAIAKHEWRIFFFLNPFDDLTAYRLFTALHIPLFALIIALSNQRNFQIGFDVFLIAHAGLHWLFRHHPKYEFHDRFSHALIVGAALLGLLHLILVTL